MLEAQTAQRLFLLLATTLGRCGLGLLHGGLLLGLVGIRILARILEHVSQTTLATVMAIEVHGHVHTSAALIIRALLTKALNLSRRFHTVVLENRKLNLLVLALDFAGLGVGLLLALLASTKKSQREVEGAFLREILKPLRVQKLMSRNNQALLVRRNSCK